MKGIRRVARRALAMMIILCLVFLSQTRIEVEIDLRDAYPQHRYAIHHPSFGKVATMIHCFRHQFVGTRENEINLESPLLMLALFRIPAIHKKR